jgi:hypothetical protein
MRKGAMKKLLMSGIIATLLLAPLAASARVVVVGPVVGVGWGWSPYWAPYWGPYPYYGYYAYPQALGALKFDTNVKDAEVYVNGAYAGTIGQLKTMYLPPASYNIEVRAPGRTQFDRRVYIAAGKTLHLNPELHVQQQSPQR